MAKKLKTWQKVLRVILVPIGVAFIVGLFAGCIYMIYELAVKTKMYSNYLFWIFIIAEPLVGIAVYRLFIYRLIREKHWLLSVAFVIAIALMLFARASVSSTTWAGPMILATNVLLLLAGVSAFAYQTIFQKYSQQRKELVIKRKIEELALTSNFNLVLPGYLPADYFAEDLDIYGEKEPTSVEVIYRNKEKENIIWLIESKKPIISESGKMETTVTSINGIDVTVGKKPRKKRKTDDEPSFTEGNWKYGDIYFNYRSDGLSLKQVEKVIASMIAKPL